MRGEIRLVTTSLCKAEHHANMMSLTVLQTETYTEIECDCSSDKMIAGVMRGRNEKDYNDNNTVSNERIEERLK